MVVGYNPVQKELSHVEYVLAGTFCGSISRAFSQPFDVVKVRFQLQKEPIRRLSTGKYHNFVQAAKMIASEEGIRSFWKGHLSGQLVSVTYMASQFYFFEAASKIAYKLTNNHSDTLHPIMYFNCGVVSGLLSTTVAHPIGVVRTRMIAQGEPRVYKNLSHACVLMFKQEGPRVFLKGLVPTYLQFGPQAGFQFLFYRFFNRLCGLTDANVDIGLMQSLLSGAVAGIGAKTVVYPFDLLKRRLQVVGFESARKKFGRVERYDSLRHAIRLILKNEGLFGFYKGLVPSLFKSAVMSGSSFYFYEVACKFLRWNHR